LTLPRTHAHSLTLSVVVADPDGGDRLRRALVALREARLAIPMEVIGALGNADKHDIAKLRQEFPLISLVSIPEGGQLGALYNKGAAIAKGRYLLLLDGTARLDGAAIEQMILFMEKGQWVGVLAPQMLTPSEQEVSPARVFPTVRTALAEFEGGVARQAAQAVLPRIQNPLTRRVTTPKEVNAVLSRCCLIKRQTFQETGLWSTEYPDGFEALDWCKRARLKGWSVFYHPGVTARLIEEEHDNPAKVAAALTSACRFIHTYEGPTSLAALKLALMALSMRALLLDGGASLIPGTHREAARDMSLRGWYVMGALLKPGRPQPA
jgi:hypothetical protein